MHPMLEGLASNIPKQNYLRWFVFQDHNLKSKLLSHSALKMDAICRLEIKWRYSGYLASRSGNLMSPTGGGRWALKDEHLPQP